MRPDENGDDHCARRVALHAHEGGMEEQFIRSVLAQDHEPVALGDTPPMEERLVERIGECALLCAREAACGNMGLENVHDRKSPVSRKSASVREDLVGRRILQYKQSSKK